ncbi:MAG TPA: hypothetical protein DCZ05_07185 [Deltaproteobacteria bacterium]|nr:MAG: hypothetical protein A2253_09230 [Deltaproteobacteria bacterium RIFOXYA2_FULL_55_11]HBA39516.1 hypothetical protein [Deltaproteobacteria bacterium]
MFPLSHFGNSIHIISYRRSRVNPPWAQKSITCKKKVAWYVIRGEKEGWKIEQLFSDPLQCLEARSLDYAARSIRSRR